MYDQTAFRTLLAPSLALCALLALTGCDSAQSNIEANLLPDGSRYSGELLNGQFHGKGQLDWPNGETYEGEFVRGLKHGTGRWRFINGSVYRGEFQHGSIAGQGAFTYRSGAHYQGQFEAGDFHGQGDLTLRNGDRYTGAFVQGVMEGEGVYLESSGSRYSGTFVDDDLTGEGSHTDPQGNRYQGGFKDWLYHGEGEYTMANGERYAGTFVDGGLTGQGVHVNADGDRYEGAFEGWRYHGQGTLRYSSGDSYQGEFQHGYRHGQGTLTLAQAVDGVSSQSGEWAYDEFLPEQRAQQQRAQSAVETLLYNQPQLLADSLARIAEERPGVIDLYFLGVAGYGTQDVFRKEVETIRTLFRQRYDIGERSLLLVNNAQTVAHYPLATRTSIEQGLQRVAEQMNREQDILFLYLTSHGSKDHRLALTMNGLSLADITPRILAESLDRLRIKHRVIMVSACYSGGYIDPLKNDHTLIITAAAKDRTSYGCSDDNDITDFARAYFQQALPQADSFESAFQRATEVIAREENDRKEKRPSQPQIAMGEALREQLGRWRASLPETH